MIKLVVNLLVVFLLLVYTTGAQAEENLLKQEEPGFGTKNHFEKLKEKIPQEKLLLLEKKSKVIDNYFKKINDLKTELYVLKKKLLYTEDVNDRVAIQDRINQLSKNISDFEYGISENTGLEKIDLKEKTLKISSSPDDVSKSVSMYYDNDSQAYVLYGDWEWINNNWIFDDWDVTPSVGGKDGFWLQISEDITRVSDTFYTYTTEGILFDSNEERDYERNGIDFMFQDYYFSNPAEYTAGRGYGYIYFLFNSPPEGLVNYQAGVAHTWSTTDLFEVIITTLQGTPSFSADNNKWSDEVNSYTNFY